MSLVLLSGLKKIVWIYEKIWFLTTLCSILLSRQLSVGEFSSIVTYWVALYCSILFSSFLPEIASSQSRGVLLQYNLILLSYPYKWIHLSVIMVTFSQATHYGNLFSNSILSIFKRMNRIHDLVQYYVIVFSQYTSIRASKTIRSFTKVIAP